eukprot:CAMPEP_0176494092 /NCGR_PEP_ID=MMETSP0200_2-20121128/9900_1 /TAXON_ID=947934 /ORGANISM="Chaetoceros sp., Strain GSL56" /LENGTH=835 /DNA_ID=CAMNT_0017891803 /DNA_START=300 /DNA_END=2807 /DNA_ORIENTATION=-
MSVPSLYGYASVIFNHNVFQPHIATLSKLVIWSSAVHQLCFVIFSSLSFAKAEVQDAGLLFLSIMTNYIADTILAEGGNIGEILSTSIVTLTAATASLGLVLMFLGKFNCANAVSYLPLPVVGGYLAFIGYFCVVAGVGLCISKSMIGGNFLTDVQLLVDRQSFVLALPGLLSGLLMMVVARLSQNDAALPLTMFFIPTSFYVFLYLFGITLDDAREGKWIGKVQESASVSSLIELVDFNQVRWDLVFSAKCLSVWFGMVFVVSFSSCLDVAAISMDMGEPLDINKELITVGFSNLISGLSFGQTGSYIFSQTILTYRTGYLSRWIGFLGVLMFLSVVFSHVNLLQVVPLFFLGSTLIFIGIDLLYEWMYEVFHKLIPSEYLVLLTTFVAIQVLGIDGGIVFGVIVAVVEYVVSTSRVSSLRRVMKQSRVVWQPHHRKLLQEVGYDTSHPKILTLEVRETVFFGSSLLLLSRICDEIGISASPTDMMEMSLASPRHFSKSPKAPTATSLISSLKRKRRETQGPPDVSSLNEKRRRPKYVLLDLSQVPNVDASAARSCFLQLAKMCSKNGIIMIATGANPRVDWILRSHDVTYSTKEEGIVKNQLLHPHRVVQRADIPSEKVLLFDSLNVALQHCETRLIYDLEQKQKATLSASTVIPHSLMETGHLFKTKLSIILSRLLGIPKENQVLNCVEEGEIAQEVSYYSGDELYTKGENADSIYVVLAGGVEIRRDASDDLEIKTTSKRRVSFSGRNVGKSRFGEVVSYLQVGGIFGYVDFMLDRRRSLNAICSKDGTILAKFTKATLEQLEQDRPDVHRIIEKALLQASLMELANFDVA